ncbi:hypothetical protein AC1031_014906 [Aphanomyces cochlioides]|nr:hypothetical protein AC1031_014906 [Aphanomyces cochlioides]
MAAASSKKSGRGKGWCAESVNYMLDQVEDIRPLGRNGWLKVERAFNSSNFAERDADTLKRKFVALKNHSKPTGDPDCPPDVARAKRICRAIDMQASVLPLSDDRDADGYESNDDNSTRGGANIEEETHAREYPRDDKPNRTGMPTNELIELSKELRKRSGGSFSETASSSGTLSYTAKRRQNLDKFIDGAMATKNDSSDFMSMMIMMDERAAAREERRLEQEEAREERRMQREYQWQREHTERQQKADEERFERERRRNEFQMALLGKLFSSNK